VEIVILVVMGRLLRSLTLVAVAVAAVAAWPLTASAQRVCWPGVKVPPFEIPAVTIPAKETPGKEIPGKEIVIPAITVPGVTIPAITIPAITVPGVTIPAITIPAITIPGITVPERCFDTEKTDAPPPSETTVRIRNYHNVDSQFSLALSVAYWRQTGPSSMVPNYKAKGFAEATASGSVKNQYVRSYVRVDGTFVPGYWRHAKRDGRPTCKIIHC
jgi:hypothetical protein